MALVGRICTALKGLIVEYIPYTSSRPAHSGFRSCKHPVALVMWDEEFDYQDSHVPLNPDICSSEKRHLGWNILRDEYVQQQRQETQLAEAEEAENRT